MRQDELDVIILSVLPDCILRRDRLVELLRAVPEKSNAADMQRQQDLDRVRREKVAAETRIRRLIEMVEDGHMSSKDPIFAERLAQYRRNVAQLEASERSLAERRITAVVPSSAARRTPYPFDRRAYRRRNQVERPFCRLKNWRRIATRYGRLACNYLAFLGPRLIQSQKARAVARATPERKLAASLS